MRSILNEIDRAEIGSRVRSLSVSSTGRWDSPTYMALTDKIGAGIKGSRTLIIPRGTHFINLDKPKEFNRAVLQFLPRKQGRNLSNNL
jgi:pimeloyl-ACP methyl ester carboxylesterase